MPIFIDVPFAEKDLVKSLGARFDYLTKKWYIPDGIEHSNFKKWLNGDIIDPLLEDVITPSTYNTNTKETEPNTIQSKSLSMLLAEVSVTISQKFSKSQKISCEISNIKKVSAGHFYLELVEHNTSGQEIAKINAIIWKDNAKIVKNFTDVSGCDFVAGIKILADVVVESSPRFGLSLNIKNLDPTFTIGEMELKVKHIIDKLTKENIINNNKNLQHPFDFQNVAVIAPDGAAGLADFDYDAQILVKNNICQFDYYKATFEGASSQESILKALSNFKKEHQTKQYDALCIIRGGGSKTSLNWLNEYQIAKELCLIDIPVFTGIGHNIDHTVLDDVSHKSLDTPSKVISHIFNINVENANSIKNNYNQIKQNINFAISKNKEQLNNTYTKLYSIATNTIFSEKEKNTFILSKILNTSNTVVRKQKANIENYMANILTLNPLNILKKGYAVIKDQEGNVITKKENFNPKAPHSIKWQDGEINIGE